MTALLAALLRTLPAAALLAAAPWPAASQIQIVTLLTDDGIRTSGDLWIAEGGKVAFKGEHRDRDVDGVYIGYPGGGVSPLVEVGAPEEIREIGGVAMSSNGTVAYGALLWLEYIIDEGQPPKGQLYERILRGEDPYEYEFDRDFHKDGPIGINNQDELFWTSRSGSLHFAFDARSGGASGWGDFYFAGGPPTSVNGIYLPPAAINNSSQVAFILRPPGEALASVMRAEIEEVGQGSWEKRITTLASGLEWVNSLGIDDSGRTVFVGQFPGQPVGLYEAGGGGAVALAVEDDGKGFRGFSTSAVSAGGKIAFTATYESPSGKVRSGIFRGFNGAADKIVAEGDRLTYQGVEWEISVGDLGPRALNDAGQVVFNGSMERPDGENEEEDRSLNAIFVTSGVPDPPDEEEPEEEEDDPPDTFRWTNPEGGGFSTAANWEPAQVPVKNGERADTALFNLGQTYTVDTPEAATERLLVRDGEVTLNVGVYTVASTSLDAPSVSITRDGLLNITGGRLQSVHTVIGRGALEAGQVAEAHLFNSGVTWDNPGRLTIGGFSAGRLFVSNGPTLTTGEARIGADARGEAIVGGTDSLWEAGTLAVGYSDEGSLIIERGGHTVAEYLYIGQPEGQGAVTVDGVGADGSQSLLTISNSLNRFWIGDGGGSGQLHILAGGMVEAPDGGFLGVGIKAGESIGTGRVSVRGFDAATGARSTLRVAPLDDLLGWIALGWEGDGRLDIENGGVVESGESFIAKEGGVAVANVSGTGNGESSEWFVEGLLAVGHEGLGEINLSDGGQVTTDHFIAGSQPEGRGVITVDGVGDEGARSRLTVHDPILGFQIGEAGGHGEMRITNGGLVEAPLFGWLVIGRSDAAGPGNGLVTVHGFDLETGTPSTLDLPPLGDSDQFGHLLVGWGGEAALRIEDGGLVRSHSAAVGRDAGSGLAVVSGLGNGVRSSWNNSVELVVGQLTTGTLRIEAGGEVRTAHLLAGKGPGGRGSIEVQGVGTDGSPSLLQVTDGLIGFDLGADGGEGVLTIEDGGAIRASGQPWLSVEKGTVTVRGVHETTQIRSSLDIDSATDGFGGLVVHGGNQVLVEDGALIACRTGVIGGLGAGAAAGLVRVRGASSGRTAHWHSSSELTVGLSTAPGSTGILTVEQDGAVTVGVVEPAPGWVRIGAGGTLHGHGLIEAPGGIGGGGVDNFAGLVSPGSSPGTLTIEGDYLQGAAGVLEIEIRGAAAGADYDRLVVAGSAAFEPGAKIRLVLMDPDPDDAVEEIFLPRTGEAFDFLVAGAVELPAGAVLNDLIEIDGLPSNVAMELRLEVREDSTWITAAAQRANYPGPPPAISGMVWSPPGLDFELTITEPAPGYAYLLETSMDLEAWTTALGRVSTGGTHVFTDRNALLRPAAFYRLAVPGALDP